MGNGREARDYHVPNLNRALSIVELLSTHREGLTKTEITEKLGYSTNSVYRITMTLIDRGYIERSESSRVFRLTSKMVSLGCGALDEQSIVAKSWEVMQDLRDELTETVLLGVRQGAEGVVLEQAQSLRPIRMVIDAGTHFALHSGAPGKVLLAYLPAAEQERVLKRMKFTRYNERTITSRKEFRRELQWVRDHGYGLDRSEVLDGIRCVASPIFDHTGRCVAALWITGPTDRLAEESYPALAEVVGAHADRISQKLGYHKESEMHLRQASGQ